MKQSKPEPFSHVLVANRGEIAVRVFRTAKRLGLRTTAVYSDADVASLHVRCADNAVPIGGQEPSASYLNISRIIDAARAVGADAIHPGYGFLAENPDFAEACAEAGLVFVGPSAAAIRLMGNKRAAKERLSAAGVRVIPGFEKPQASDAELIEAGEAIGYPLMVKASAGGGGRGMRRVNDRSHLPEAIKAARAEAANAFGDSELILERAIVNARHVEVQVFADAHGNVIHLGERDCSLQRRHQKVIEETPCPVVGQDLRLRMGTAACEVARAIGYLGAGTVEFLLSESAEFFFMEMNTRLQVEHPVTECVTGLDLVELQFKVAQGNALPIGQDDVVFRGHALEARLCAENVADGFLPQSGHIHYWAAADENIARTDCGIETGDDVSPFYDSLLAKVIVHGETRAEALRLMERALSETVLLGVTTNRRFLLDIIRNDVFRRGAAVTTFVEECFGPDELAKKPLEGLVIAVMAARVFKNRQAEKRPLWTSGEIPEWPLRFMIDDELYAARVSILDCGYLVRVANEHWEFEVTRESENLIVFQAVQGQVVISFARDGDDLHVGLENGETYIVRSLGYGLQTSEQENSDKNLLAPMAGSVQSILVSVGDAVKKGQALFVVEAMKMQHTIIAQNDGVIEEITARAGDQVTARQPIIVMANGT